MAIVWKERNGAMKILQITDVLISGREFVEFHGDWTAAEVTRTRGTAEQAVRNCLNPQEEKLCLNTTQLWFKITLIQLDLSK